MPETTKVDINRAASLTREVADTVDDMFLYHPWSPDQQEAGIIVRDALATAFKAIIEHVPPSPDRTVALRKIREARMDCNSAITFKGRY